MGPLETSVARLVEALDALETTAKARAGDAARLEALADQKAAAHDALLTAGDGLDRAIGDIDRILAADAALDERP